MIEMHDRKKVIELLKRSEVFFGDLTYDGIKISTKDVAKLIEDQPEIVRCQDCKHGHKCEFSIRCENKNMPPMFGQHFSEDWFCADGKGEQTMPDVEKVIEALHCRAYDDDFPCSICAYYRPDEKPVAKCDYRGLMDDAIALLKKQQKLIDDIMQRRASNGEFD